MCPQASHPENTIPSTAVRLSHLLLVGTISTLILAGTESLISQSVQASPLIAEQPIAEQPIAEQTTEPITPPTAEFYLKAVPELDAHPASDTAIADPPIIVDPVIKDDVALNAFADAAEYQALPFQSVEAFQSSEEPVDIRSASSEPEAIADRILPELRSDIGDVQTVPSTPDESKPSESSPSESRVLGVPLVRAQAAYILQDGDSSGRLRAAGTYAVTPNILFGATLDLTGGNGFSDSEDVAFDLNELYVTVSPESLPNLHFTAGIVDLTSYFDRNSFAKDSVTHFFNSVFQTNPALAATGIGSRPAVVLNWDLTDDLNVKAAGFSSSRDFGNLAIDGFSGEVGARFGNFVVRGTYATDRDAGQNDGFREIFQFDRGNDRFGLRSGDREEAFGVNAEVFIPELNLGLFGRYGHYQNLALDRGGETYSFGLNLLDVFRADDRLGLAYGRQLSNSELRRDRTPDVLEAFYDFRLSPNLRAGVTVQERNGFSDTVLGLRIRADFDVK